MPKVTILGTMDDFVLKTETFKNMILGGQAFVDFQASHGWSIHEQIEDDDKRDKTFLSPRTRVVALGMLLDSTTMMSYLLAAKNNDYKKSMRNLRNKILGRKPVSLRLIASVLGQQCHRGHYNFVLRMYSENLRHRQTKMLKKHHSYDYRAVPPLAIANDLRWLMANFFRFSGIGLETQRIDVFMTSDAWKSPVPGPVPW